MRRAGLGTCVVGATILMAPCAEAQDLTTAQINAIEQQIHALQSELHHMRQALSQRDQQVQAARRAAAEAQATAARVQAQIPTGPSTQYGPTGGAQVPPGMVGPATPVTTGPPLPRGAFQLGAVTVTLGGYIDMRGIFRTRNEAADVGSSWSGIPLGNSPNHYENEFHMSARATRLSLLMQGHPDPASTLAGYIETDFQGAAPTSNSVQSNSYVPRLRQAYAQYDNSALGLHVLAGQAWSLLTQYKVGLVPRQENVPITMDNSYLPGFTYARQPQLRIDKDFDNHRLWLAMSLENPQTTWNTSGYTTTGGNTAALPDGFDAQITTPGGSGYAPTVNYSDNIAPDIILKAAYDPGWGHYEAFGIARFITDRVDTVGWGKSNTVLAGGGGADAILPIIPKKLEFEARALVGTGIGRYGAGGLPDATLKPDGTPAPIPEVQAMIGLVGHPTPRIDLFSYVGTEQESRTSFNEVIKGKNTGFGYGSVLYSNAGCDVELSPLTCTGNTSGLTQGTLGGYYKFIKGPWGTMEAGAQYSYTHRQIFLGVGGAPYANEQVIMVDLRYLPFQ